MQNILVVEDDHDLNQAICYSLKKSGYGTYGAESAESGRTEFLRNRIDLVLLDVNLPDGEGFSFCRWIKSRKETPVIYLTARDMEEDVLTGYESGAEDYITKPFNILEVKARMKAILRRNAVTEKKAAKSNIINAGDMKIDCDSRNLYIAGRPINLTAKEFDLLELLAVNPGKVYSRDNLLKAVWGQDYSGDGRTVDVHMRRLREKIEDNPSEPKYVHTKWGVGYYFNV